MFKKICTAVLITSTFAPVAFGQMTGKKIAIMANEMTASEEDCKQSVENHIKIINESEKYLIDAVKKSNENITGHQIAILQKVIKARFEHLVKTRSLMASQDSCGLPQFAEAIAVHDFNLLAMNTMADTETRRILHSFTKADDSVMRQFKKEYYHYTDINTIKAIRESLTQQEIGLVQAFGLQIDQQESGIPFSTTADKTKRIWGWVLGKGVVRSWGYISDTLKVRHGYLKKNAALTEMVRNNLKPLDLLFEKRKFVLSNYTIPGHWGHVAIWLGTKQDLQAKGIWDSEALAPFREHIENGRSIVQMRKEGVVFNTLEEFMNLDEMAVMRVNHVQNKTAQVLANISENLNKSYDFSFDAKTIGKITCTELVTFSYGKITWPSHISVGRSVVSPDDMAKLSLDPAQAQPILYAVGEGLEAQLKTSNDWYLLLGPNQQESQSDSEDPPARLTPVEEQDLGL